MGIFKKNTKKEETAPVTEGKTKALRGVVVSDKMTDTCVVEIQRYFKHARYGKFVKRHKKFKAHDAGNTAKIGDKVEIKPCTPISKDKRFTLVK
jgi:small subunit ribosomal protein S17